MFLLVQYRCLFILEILFKILLEEIFSIRQCPEIREGEASSNLNVPSSASAVDRWEKLPGLAQISKKCQILRTDLYLWDQESLNPTASYMHTPSHESPYASRVLCTLICRSWGGIEMIENRKIRKSWKSRSRSSILFFSVTIRKHRQMIQNDLVEYFEHDSIYFGFFARLSIFFEKLNVFFVIV